MKTYNHSTTPLGGSTTYPNLSHNHHRTKLFLFTLTTITLIFSLLTLISCGVKDTTTATTTNGGTALPVIADFETARLFTIVSNGTVPDNLSSETDTLVKETLGRIGATAGAQLNVIYVTEAGSGNMTGTNWQNTLPAANLRTALTSISAGASSPHLVLLSAGTYKTTYANTGADRDLSFAMTNHTAIIGGFNITVNANNVTVNRGGITAFDGNIGDAGVNTDNTKHIFRNNGINRTAVLYGVTVRNGNGGNGDRGNGMNNNNASPSIIHTLFINNNGFTLSHGGAVYNLKASPLFKHTDFVANTASSGGGGVYNQNSAPVFEQVNFLFNRVTGTGNGGGVHNDESSPLFVNVTFMSNIVNGISSSLGGAMQDRDSSSTIINSTIINNSATGQYPRGGINVWANSVRGTYVLNSILWDNNPDQISMESAIDKLLIAGNVLQGGTAGITGTTTGVTPYAIFTDSPQFSGYPTVGSPLNTPVTIPASSPATNIGLHIKIDGEFQQNRNGLGATLYYSTDNANWYTNITATGLTGDITTTADIPGTARDLTTTDITGFPRTGRPDAGAYEAR